MSLFLLLIALKNSNTGKTFVLKTKWLQVKSCLINITFILKTKLRFSMLAKNISITLS